MALPRARRSAVLGAASALALAVALASACADLPQVQPGVCGNRVVEPKSGEECDTFDTSDGFKCSAGDVKLGGCRIECKDDRSCRAGAACGADGICRRPSGAFDFDAKATVRVSGVVRHVKVGDFDGDHRADVLGETLTDLRVHFFDGRATPSRTVQLQGSGAVAIGSITTSDALSSIVIGSNDTLAVWRGQVDRSLATVLYPTLPLPTTGDLRLFVGDGLSQKAGLAYLGDELFVMQGNASATAVFPGKQEAAAPVTLLTIPRPITDVLTPSIARLQNFPQCDSMVWGLPGGPQVYVYSLCITDSFWAQNLSPRVVLATKALDASSRIVTGRVNADLLADLVIQTPSSVEVAYATGDGSFDANPFVGANGNGLTAPMPLYAPKKDVNTNALPKVLAVGDIDGDNRGDVVDTAGIWLSSLPGYGYTATLSSAFLTDLNGDKKNDVIATTPLGTLFLFGTSSKFLNAAFYALDAVPDRMTVADLDGDIVPDVLVSTRAGKSTDGLYVQWGRAAQFPEAPAFVGTLPPVATMASGRLAPFLLTSNNQAVLTSTAMAPMLVQSEKGPLQAPLLVGDASRVLTSPFLLSKQVANGSIVLGEIVSLALGHFDGTGHLGMAALAFDIGASGLEGAHLWSVPSHDDAELDSSAVVRTEAELPIARVRDDQMGRLWQEPLQAAIDLDRDGTDELVTLAPPDLLPALPVPKTGRAFLSRFGAKGFETTSLDVGAAGSVFATARGWAVHAFDLDGDGWDDLALMSLDADRQPHMRVWINDGSGTIDVAKLVDVALPALGAVEIATDFTAVRVDPQSNRRAIVLLTSQRLILSRWADAASFAQPTTLGPAQTGGHSIAAGDVDGDGVEDLVVADAQGLVVYFGVEATP